MRASFVPGGHSLSAHPRAFAEAPAAWWRPEAGDRRSRRRTSTPLPTRSPFSTTPAIASQTRTTRCRRLPGQARSMRRSCPRMGSPAADGEPYRGYARIAAAFHPGRGRTGSGASAGAPDRGGADRPDGAIDPSCRVAAGAVIEAAPSWGRAAGSAPMRCSAPVWSAWRRLRGRTRRHARSLPDR